MLGRSAENYFFKKGNTWGRNVPLEHCWKTVDLDCSQVCTRKIGITWGPVRKTDSLAPPGPPEAEPLSGETHTLCFQQTISVTPVHTNIEDCWSNPVRFVTLILKNQLNPGNISEWTKIRDRKKSQDLFRLNLMLSPRIRLAKQFKNSLWAYNAY